jgi:hypothetical protein
MKAFYQLVKLRFWGHLQGKVCRESGMNLVLAGVLPALSRQAELSLQVH